MILLLFAFLSGLVTIFAPCIWPLLPIILSSSSAGGARRPLGISLGISLSFAFFTLAISYLLRLFPFDPNLLRLVAVVVIGLLGLTLVVPALSSRLEALVSRFMGRVVIPGQTGTGFWGGLITGLALGIVWSPCAGPILATIAALAATAAVNREVILVTLVYVAGVGIPLFLFASAGSFLLTKTPVLSQYTGRIQQVFGVIMILTALLIYTNYDKVLQAKLLDAVPAYSDFIYRLEGNPAVKEQLDQLKGSKNTKQNVIGKPFDMLSGSNLPNLGRAPEFTGINKWLNTDKPLSLASLRGKVVLVDFWTYTCINCIRTLPHVTGWYEKYKDKGLVVIGVHTPEFEFEKNTGNVQNAIQQYGIHYPVAQDNNYATWNAYNNHYWPAKYLIDASGNTRYVHFGEGEYEKTEENIQKLLLEAGNPVPEKVASTLDQTPKGALTPETYLGSSRAVYYFPGNNLSPGAGDFTLEPNPPLNYFSLGGNWMIGQEYSVSGQNAVLVENFLATKVFLVLRPGANNKLVKIKVLLDGKVVGEPQAGSDVQSGIVTVDSDRLYNLIDLHGEKSSHLLRLEFLTPGTELYAFTFG